MIEVPRAALCAEEIARHAQFFSFGTNDLTQMALGLSRDNSAKFMELYLQRGIYPADPFSTLDIEGVGALLELACRARPRGRADLKLGICGEHGGDPRRSRSASGSASTTSPARPTGCRSPASRRPRRRSRPAGAAPR